MKWLRQHPKTAEDKQEYEYCEYSVPKLKFLNEDGEEEGEDASMGEEEDDDEEEEDDDKTMASE